MNNKNALHNLSVIYRSNYRILYGQFLYSFVDKESLSKMAGVYRNLLVLGLVVYVVCMLVSLGESAPSLGKGQNNDDTPAGNRNRRELRENENHDRRSGKPKQLNIVDGDSNKHGKSNNFGSTPFSTCI